MLCIKSLKAGALAVAMGLAMAGTAMAATITGMPSTNPTAGWSPNSTNALNYASLVPGRIGQDAPHVLLAATGPGSVFLDFFNFGPGLAFFEIRLDGIQTGANPHPVAIGDTIHTGGNAVASGTSELGMQYFANNTVEVRLALGGERDWDFDWTSFDVGPITPIPLPASMPLLLVALGGLGFAARRRKVG